MSGNPRLVTQVRIGELVPARDLVADKLAELGPGAALHYSQRLVTTETEHAVLAYLVGFDLELAVGVVYGDAECVVMTSIRTSDRAEWWTRTQAELAAIQLGLEPARPRRFHHRALGPGWRARPEGLTAIWMADDATARITVEPARFAAPVAMPWSQLDVTTPAGLVGTLAMLRDDRGYETEVAALHDGRRWYSLRLDTTAARVAEHRATFASLLDSIEPVPVRRAPSDDTFAHWSE